MHATTQVADDQLVMIEVRLSTNRVVQLANNLYTNEWYVTAKNLLGETYYHGPYSYRASALRWAQSHVNQTKLPCAILLDASSVGYDAVEQPQLQPKLPVADKDIQAFKLLYGEDVEYEVSPTGLLRPKRM